MRDDREAIRGALTRLRQETKLPMLFGGPLARGTRLHLTEFIGSRSGTMQGLRVEHGAGLGGRAVQMRRPVMVREYSSAAAITHEYDTAVLGEDLRSMVGVPVVVGRSVRAVLYGAARGAAVIGDRMADAVVSGARLLEQELAVHDVLRERNAADHGIGVPGLRRIREELLSICADVDDTGVRTRLENLAGELGREPCADGAPVALSPREVEVLRHVAVGRTNAEIGEQLGVGAETVKSYLRTAMRKLGVGNRIEAVVRARAAALL